MIQEVIPCLMVRNEDYFDRSAISVAWGLLCELKKIELIFNLMSQTSSSTTTTRRRRISTSEDVSLAAWQYVSPAPRHGIYEDVQACWKWGSNYRTWSGLGEWRWLKMSYHFANRSRWAQEGFIGIVEETNFSFRQLVVIWHMALQILWNFLILLWLLDLAGWTSRWWLDILTLARHLDFAGLLCPAS